MSDDMRTMIVSSITSLTEQANAEATRIASATTDRKALVHDILNADEPTDEKVKKFQEFKEQILARLEQEEEKAREYVSTTLLPAAEEFDVDAAKSTYKELADKVKTARKFFLTTLPGATEDDLKDVPALKTLRGGTSSGGTGSKRPRVNRLAYRANSSDNWTEVSKSTEKNGETVTVTNFTVLAQSLSKVYGSKVEVKDLQAAAFEAAGTDDLNSLDGKVFEFAVSVGDKSVFVQVQPKSESDD